MVAGAARQLIVNADDFGLTPGVNRAVLQLNRAGVLPSATLMATGGAFRAAAHDAFVQPELSVGCHLVLLDGAPVLHPADLPTLAPGGQLRPTLGAFLRDLLRGRIREAEIEAEATAQIRRLQTAGITPAHVDTHKHTHMFGRVLRPVLRAALACGVPAIRNPFEPLWATRATPGAPRQRRWEVHLLRTRRPSFLRAVRRAGLATTDGAVGVLATGTLDEATLEQLLAAMPAGVWELVCHPGYPDADLEAVRTRLVGTRETERAALLEVLPRALASNPGLSLINFEQLAG